MKKLEYYEVLNVNSPFNKVYGSFTSLDEANMFAEYLNTKENTDFRAHYFASKITREVFDSFKEKLAYDAYKRANKDINTQEELVD